MDLVEVVINGKSVMVDGIEFGDKVEAVTVTHDGSGLDSVSLHLPACRVTTIPKEDA